jgi:hypothetical protein
MRVTLTAHCAAGCRGQVLDLPEAAARRLVESGRAIAPAHAGGAQTATVRPPENAATRTRKPQ